MKKKVERQLAIRKIIQNGKVHSQEELLLQLKKNGFDLTQATLSRDLKVLQVAKVPHPTKGYVYVVQGAEKLEKTGERTVLIFLLTDSKMFNFPEIWLS